MKEKGQKSAVAASVASSSGQNGQKLKKSRPTGSADEKKSTKQSKPQDGAGGSDAEKQKQLKNRKKKKPKTKGGSNNKDNNKDKAKAKKKPAPVAAVDGDAADGDDVAAVAPAVRRDFSQDLNIYLSQWSHKDEYGGWKFNKNLQIWALEYCFDVTKIDNELFKSLLPYLASIQGNALERLLQRADKIVDDATNEEAEGGDNDATDGALKRALKIRTKVGKKELSLIKLNIN